MLKVRAFLCIFLTTILFSIAQKPKQLGASEIYHEIQKLNFLGSALFVAAHPDDENTRLIAYLSNQLKAKTTYLSLTRGDGGQNLIGPELRELLGMLRTQELLAARRVDGGYQRFTRANDFGFSKHPNETLKIWNKKQVLGDVVWAIRQLKPDVIINRFDHRSPGSTHGHHTASAMLSFEAFDLSNDTNAYTEQLALVEPWQPKRLFFNTSWWFYGSREKFQAADKSNLSKLDVGVYYPELGLSNNEIASLASSQHLCQGFGRVTTRGSQDDYVEFLKGDPLNDTSDIFDGINTSWSRVQGGEAIGAILNQIEANFNFKNPSIHLEELVRAYSLIQNIEDEHWKIQKSKHLKEIILASAGLYLEANASQASATPGETLAINFELLNRSNANIQLKTVTIADTNSGLQPNMRLANNKKQSLELDFTIPNNTPYTNPYWLNEPGDLGMYAVADKSLVGLPETPYAFEVEFVVSLFNTDITFKKPLYHRYSKPDKGELFEPFVILPGVTADFADDVLIFANDEPKQVAVAIRAGKNNINGMAQLNTPDGWEVHPAAINFSISQKGETQTVYFEVTPPSGESEGFLSPRLTSNGRTFDKALVEISYDHIPKQSILLPSKAKVVRLNIQKSGENIGYIIGAGDNVPESLEQIGYNVQTINVSEIEQGSLNKYDGIVVGIRAYNVIETLKFKQKLLFDYVSNGGNMIVQYNTANRWRNQFENIAPYPLTVSRDRVTDENAAVTILAKDHPVVNFPNIITDKDFDGWVQERGLYFPNDWDDAFTPILSMRDDGETEKQGSLLVAPYGKGNYIYTGLSFFRELPAGVSGAYKLFANMLSLGKENIKNEGNIKG